MSGFDEYEAREQAERWEMAQDEAKEREARLLALLDEAKDHMEALLTFGSVTEALPETSRLLRDWLTRHAALREAP